VVFIDDCKWSAFDQLSVSLRRAGVRTIRITTDGRRQSRLESRLLFDRYVEVAHASELRGLKEILQGELVVDVQCVESLVQWIDDPVHASFPDLGEQLKRRVAVIDKLQASRMFSGAGIRAPEAIPLTEISPEDVAQKFGFPIVVKQRIGYGGGGVQIVHDLPELLSATPSDSAEAGAFFYEQFIHGNKLDYAAAISPAGIEQELTYRVTKWKLPVGRATEIVTIDDPKLLAFGRKVLDIIGCLGFVNMDVIRDERGDDWVIDVNPRAFGGSIGFMSAGIKVSEGYLRSIGLSDAPPTVRTPQAGVRFPVFPTCLEDVIDSGNIVPVSRAFLYEARPYLKWLGLRYWLSEGIEVVFLLRRARQARAGGETSSTVAA
jgi:hypothetical protein